MTSSAFITAMERGLASAYYMAFQRQGAGGLSPSRRKRFAALLNSSDHSAGSQRRKRAVVNEVEVTVSSVYACVRACVYLCVCVCVCARAFAYVCASVRACVYLRVCA